MAQVAPGRLRWQDDDCRQQAELCPFEVWEDIQKKNLDYFCRYICRYKNKYYFCLTATEQQKFKT